MEVALRSLNDAGDDMALLIQAFKDLNQAAGKALVGNVDELERDERRALIVKTHQLLNQLWDKKLMDVLTSEDTTGPF